MSGLPACPRCASAYTYADGPLLVCPECAHEWDPAAVAATDAPREVRDAVGNVLADGDTVTVIKDLKVKGASSALKVGTKVRNIRLVEGDHDIDCRIEGFGAMQLKSEFVRKA
ncbi:MAG TPA: zinc ribbon domain-containing protein YjdM [Xanthomonadaceae bacterium]|nr:zinc ribbon domain-containing protein YjdM [Xanthomonadaceae bacterium]